MTAMVISMISIALADWFKAVQTMSGTMPDKADGDKKRTVFHHSLVVLDW